MSSYFLKELKYYFHFLLVPLFLIVCCPIAVFVIWYTNAKLGGSLTLFQEIIWQNGIVDVAKTVILPNILGSYKAWAIIAVFGFFQALLLKFLPGKKILGPITQSGEQPSYVDNGFKAYLITITTFFVGSYLFNFFSPTILYDNLGPLLGALNILSLTLCLFLLVKGLKFPSSKDHGSSGNLIFDYYWGTELYPRLLGINIKQFTNCRFGMMIWPLLLFSYAAKQVQVYGYLSNSMLISVVLQTIYVTKFFIWESGYLRSLDIMHDRAGYYICWGCLVWVPAVYTSPSMYLVFNPVSLSPLIAALLLILGTSFIITNYLADRQRQIFRATNGNCKVWGKKPTYIKASYKTEQGEVKENLLLTSGWWGLSRHFHYLPEIGGALCWSLPALFDNFLPYFYVSFLVILLSNRAFRDDERCYAKYGFDWEKYCLKVPYKLVPYII